MVECHLLGSCRALLAQERKKVRRNPREMGCVCARTLNFPETFPREHPEPGWLTLQLSMAPEKCFWKCSLVPNNSQTTWENFWGVDPSQNQARDHAGCVGTPAQPVPGDIPWH